MHMVLYRYHNSMGAPATHHSFFLSSTGSTESVYTTRDYTCKGGPDSNRDQDPHELWWTRYLTIQTDGPKINTDKARNMREDLEGIEVRLTSRN